MNALAHSAYGRIQDITNVFNTKILELNNRAAVFNVNVAPLVDNALAAAIDSREIAEHCVAQELQHSTIFLSDIDECVGRYRNEADGILDDLYEQYEDILNCSD